MKYVFAFIVLVHGLIHLMGFSKAFGVGQITSLTRDISKQTGAIWLLAALLFLIAGTGYLFKKEWWQVVAAFGVVVSQILIILSWQDAKFHEKEAEIIANAGKPGAITIATNMAGRGTDIVLGGAQKHKDLMEKWTESDSEIEEFKTAIKKKDFDKAKNIAEAFAQHGKKKKAKEILEEALNWEKFHEEVLNAGGLHILGTERHEARRIDNQLRGRSGRQGDPGSSRFYLSLEDDLMRIFGSDRISNIMQKLGMDEGQEIEHKMVSNAIARSQKRVEGHNFDIRKHLLEYDDVMNAQRIFIYRLRNDVLNEQANIEELIEE